MVDETKTGDRFMQLHETMSFKTSVLKLDYLFTNAEFYISRRFNVARFWSKAEAACMEFN